MSEFHFLRPWWLAALLPLAALLWTLHRRRRGSAEWREFCDPALLPHVVIGGSSGRSERPFRLAALAGILAILALAGPAWERLPTPVFRNLSALVVVLDLSLAMNSADVKPSRLERARYKIADILQARKDGQTALVVYGGDAFTVTPLTDDAATVAALLSTLDPGLLPVHGARVDLGLEAAGRLLQQAGLRTGDVLLVTAGEQAKQAMAAAESLLSRGYRLSVLGAGTEEGAPVPLPQGGFLKDERGDIVVPKLDAPALRALAAAGGGIYRSLDSGSGDLNALLRFFDRRATEEEQTASTVHIDQWREAGIWLLPILLPLAALGFRRGWLAVIPLALLGAVPETAHALTWEDLWTTREQQAQRAFDQGDYGRAAELFENPEWKAAAQYRAGAEAAKTLEGLDTARTHYNRGNALARQGRYEDALKAYDRSLALNGSQQPEHDRGLEDDARFNRSLVEEALKKQREQQKKQEQQQDQAQRGEQQPQQSAGQDRQKDRHGSEQQDPNKDGQQGSDSAQNQAGDQDRESGQQGDDPKESAQNQPAGTDSQESQPGQEQADAAQRQDGQSDGDSQRQAETAQGSTEGSRDAPAGSAEAKTVLETRQAAEQWLRRIPDDPGGLLKRKFLYQYRQRQQSGDAEREPW